MYRLLSCKVKEDQSRAMLDDEADGDQCPTSEALQEQMREYCANLVAKVGRQKSGRNGRKGGDPEGPEGAKDAEEEELSWVDKLAQLMVSVPPPPKRNGDKDLRKGTENFRQVGGNDRSECDQWEK